MTKLTPQETKLRLDIPLSRQRLFGFLLDSVEGLASHSRVEDSLLLEISLTDGQFDEFQTWLGFWDQFRINEADLTKTL